MRIFCSVSGREAKPVKGKNDATPVYKCFPPGGKKNLDINAKKFARVEEAANYLRSTSGGGIRVASIGTAKGQATAILNKNLIIEHNDGRRELP